MSQVAHQRDIAIDAIFFIHLCREKDLCENKWCWFEFAMSKFKTMRRVGLEAEANCLYCQWLSLVREWMVFEDFKSFSEFWCQWKQDPVSLPKLWSEYRSCCTRLFSLATCVCFIEGKGTLRRRSYALYCLMSANYQFPRILSHSWKSHHVGR
jgi:hypothetical protein